MTQQDQYNLGAFPALPYAPDALEPHFDRATMELHYGKHMRAYYDNANAALAKIHEAHTTDDLQTIEDQTRIFYNNCGGFYNHKLFFWQFCGTGKTLVAGSPLMLEIQKVFGSLEKFQTAFEQAGLSHFGSGWVWLVRHKTTRQLSIENTLNQDPVRGIYTPILAIDVWEHAYYLKYQNRRGEYLKAVWTILDWHTINERFVNS